MANTQVTAFGANGLMAQDLIKRDVESSIYRYSPFQYPLSSILTNISISDEFGGGVKSEGINKKVINSYKHEFIEKEYVTAKTLVNGAIADDTTTSIVVDDASMFIVNDILRIIDADDATSQTTEQVLVTAVDEGTNTITVTRGFGSTAALAGFADDSKVVKISTGFGEASSAPAAKFEVSDTKECYVQLFRTSVEVSEEAQDQELVAGKAWEDTKSEQAIKHAIDIESALWFNEGGYKSINGKQGYLTAGIIPQIKAYNGGELIEVITGGLTEEKLYAFLRKGFAYGSNSKILFASGVVQDAVAQFAKEVRRIGAGDKDNAFGMNITEYSTPNGSIQVIQHPLFNEDYGMENGAVLLDVAESCDYLVHSKGATTFEEHTQVNGEMKRKGDFRTRAGLKFSAIRNNRLMIVS